MPDLHYTIDDKRYEGITRFNQASKLVPGVTLVVVWSEGEPDMWLIDGLPGRLSTLRDIYEQDEPAATFQTFRSFNSTKGE